MRRIFSVFFTLLLSLSLFSCNKKPVIVDNESSAGLTPAIVEEMLYAYGNPNAYINKYYGKVNECHIVEIGVPDLAHDNISPMGVAGYLIRPTTNFAVLVYHNGNFYSLRDAYNCSLITKEDIYTQCCIIDPTFKIRYPDAQKSYTQDSIVRLDTTSLTDVNFIPNVDLSAFSKFADSWGFTEGLSNEEFVDNLSNYVFGDTKLSDMVQEKPSVSEITIGASGILSDLFYDYYYMFLDNEELYRYSFSIGNDYDNIEMPYNICFGDSPADVASKMGIEYDLLTYLPESSKGSSDTVTIYRNDTTTFEIYRNNGEFCETVAITQKYMFLFTEQLTPSTERRIEFGFSSLSGNPLAYFSIKVEEAYIPRIVTFNNTSYFDDDFYLMNEYREGQRITLNLPTATEQYYKVYVNGEEIPMRNSDYEYCYFTFTVPATDVYVEIEPVGGVIPE